MKRRGIKSLNELALLSQFLSRIRKLHIKHIVEHAHRMLEIADVISVPQRITRRLCRDHAIVGAEVAIIEAQIALLNRLETALVAYFVVERSFGAGGV